MAVADPDDQDPVRRFLVNDHVGLVGRDPDRRIIFMSQTTQFRKLGQSLEQSLELIVIPIRLERTEPVLSLKINRDHILVSFGRKAVTPHPAFRRAAIRARASARISSRPRSLIPDARP